MTVQTVQTVETVQVGVRGRFDLRQTAMFGFAHHTAPGWDGAYRLTFSGDTDGEPTGVVLRQAGPDAPVSVEVGGGPWSAARAAQVARIVSLDVDATGWDSLGRADPVVGALQAVKPGMRPPLFGSAYEALAWAVLSARRPRAQMAVLRARLSAAHGTTFTLAGQDVAAFPAPAQLLAVPAFPGLPAEKLARLHGVARAALAGELDATKLRALDPAEAAARARRLDGIGPFYAELLTIRALGHTDVLATTQIGVVDIAAGVWERPLDQASFEALASAYVPWRTWLSVLLRACGPQLVATR